MEKLKVTKVPGGENLADALTKYVTGESLEKHMKGTKGKVEKGTQEPMPEVGC